MCPFCTFVNAKPSTACEMCSLECKDLAGDSVPHIPQQTPASTKEPAQPRPRPQPAPRLNMELKRQETMKTDGLSLIHQIRVGACSRVGGGLEPSAQFLTSIWSLQEAEKSGISPEEVYAAILCSGSGVRPCDWLASELPHLLDEICAMAASVQLTYQTGESGTAEGPRDGEEEAKLVPAGAPGGPGEGLKLSRAEAKVAWLAAGGDTEKAVRQLLRDRQLKVGRRVLLQKRCRNLDLLSDPSPAVCVCHQLRELNSLGFTDTSQCQEALWQSGGELKVALSLLQRSLLEPFRARIWSDQPEPPIDPKHPDKPVRAIGVSSATKPRPWSLPQ